MNQPKITNWFNLILIILGVIIFGVIIFITVISISGNKKNNLNFNSLNQIENNLISQNLISYLKKEIPTEPKINENSPILGKDNAPITIFEFSSFGCSYGQEAQKIVSEILKKYPNQVKLIWKDLPLPEIYPDATLAHQAGRCAQNQGKFWPYYDKIWQLAKIDQASLEKIAQEIKLNLSDFRSCLADKKIDAIIAQDTAEADALMIPAVPYFYINSQELMGNVKIDDFIKIIETEINRDKK